MSKKAGYKPDFTYHDEDEYYNINDGILDEDPGDTEYTDWCNQCGNQRLGYLDPSSNLFYCNPCWTAFSSPQQPQPIQQTQSQVSQTSQSSKQSNESNQKKSRPRRKNKNKTKNKNKQSPQNTNKNPPSKSDIQNTQTEPSTKKQPSSQPPPNNNNNNNKSTDITNRPSIFDKVGTNQKNTKSTDFLSNRPSLFGDTHDNSPPAPEIKNDNIINDEDENEIKIEPIQYVKSLPKMERKKSIKKSKSKSAVIERQFIGHRVESLKTYNRHKQQKTELIKERFGIIDETKATDIDFSIDHDKDGDKKAKRKHKTKHEAKPHINLVVIGHVDAGKSTLMGRLLYEYGVVTNKTMHKYKTQSSEKGKGSFAYAWVLDCHEEERKRGITVDVSTHYFETENRCITLLDSPGHKDFIPNMISGASQADAAILVINSKKGDFETGFDINNGQTREHALIAKSLGVQQVIVAVNKMDCCEWDKQRFDMIVSQLKAFLKEIGFVNKSKNKKKRNVVFIPVSGLTGGNLIADDKRNVNIKGGKDEYDKIKNKWWRKQKQKDPFLTNLSLFEVINKLKPSSTILNDSLNGKLRLSITDIYKELNVGIMATGKIVSGSIMNYQQILIQPLNLVTKIKNLISIENHAHKYKHQIAIKGDNIQLLLDIKDNNDEIFDQIKIGDIITSPHEPLKLIKKFKCKIVTMKNLKIPICKGHHVIIHTQSVEKEAYIYKIDNMLNKKSGQIEKGNRKHIRHIKADECAIVTIKLKNQNDIILLDTYQNLKELGRITIRRDGQTIALGLVETV